MVFQQLGVTVGLQKLFLTFNVVVGLGFSAVCHWGDGRQLGGSRKLDDTVGSNIVLLKQ